MSWIATLVLGGIALAEEPQVLGPEFAVTDEAEPWSGYSRIASRDDGSFLVVWNTPFPEDNIMGLLVDEEGAPHGSSFRISSEFIAVSPAAASFDDGRFVVTYLSEPDDYPVEQLWDLRGRIVDATGRLTGDEFTIEDHFDINSQGPAVATFASGEFVVAWNGEVREEQYSFREVIQGRRYRADGTPAGEPFVVDTETQVIGRTGVVALEDESAFLVWEDIEGVSGRRYSADGQPLEELVLAGTDDSVISGPQIDTLNGNDLIVSWIRLSTTDDEGVTLPGSIRVRRFAVDGTPLGPEIVAMVRDMDRHQRYRLSSLGRDGFVIVVDESPIAMRAFRADGTPRGDTLFLESDAEQRRPDVADLGDGKFIVTWTRQESSPFRTSIRGQSFTTRCLPTGDILCLGADRRFRATVSWRDFEDRRGVGHVVPVSEGAYGSEASGLFWFFSPDNWEMLVKTVDGCDFNGHHWIFAAAITDVEYELRVEDTVTGLSKSYDNPLGQASDAVTDTTAFALCL